MPTYNDTTDKLEQAAQALAGVLTYALDRAVNTGVDDDSYELPNVVCSAEEGEEYPLGSGNFWVKLRVTVNTGIGLETLANHQADFKLVADTFMESAIENSLSDAVADFHVIGVRGRMQGRAIKEKAHSHFIELDVLACSTDIG